MGNVEEVEVFTLGTKKNDWLPGRRRATSGLRDLFLSFFASLSANTANSRPMSLLLAASRLDLQKNSGLKVPVFLPVDPRRLQGLSRVDPEWIQGVSKMDPEWIQGGSRVDPGCLHGGSSIGCKLVGWKC